MAMPRMERMRTTFSRLMKRFRSVEERLHAEDEDHDADGEQHHAEGDYLQCDRGFAVVLHHHARVAGVLVVKEECWRHGVLDIDGLNELLFGEGERGRDD